MRFDKKILQTLVCVLVDGDAQRVMFEIFTKKKVLFFKYLSDEKVLKHKALTLYFKIKKKLPC